MAGGVKKNVMSALAPADARRLRVQQVFTTGQVARLCAVAPRTVSKWCDSGALPCHRLPMAADRRITREALVRFLTENGAPLPEPLAGPACRLLLVLTPSAGLADAVADALGEDSGWVAERAADAAAAGAELIGRQPDGLLLDFAAGSMECRSVARLNASSKHVALPLAFAPEDGSPTPAELEAEGFAYAWQSPADPAAVAKYLAARDEHSGARMRKAMAGRKGGAKKP